jgi:hypothetical protein
MLRRRFARPNRRFKAPLVRREELGMEISVSDEAQLAQVKE